MSHATELYRFCARCGREMPPQAAIGVCTRCALLEAEGNPTSESEPLFFDDLTLGHADARQLEAPGQMIGRYKLLEKVGEGGCGVVYVAEQQEPIHRRVAIKVIKLGMDTRAVVARFEAERQALAMMDHPNIAKVLDAGATDTGRPYFVMELVRGIRITDYCDQANQSTKDRLALFMRVCQAIQHAHQKGIIHRDIKPSNILVTLHDGVPVPKVIDFGIAKATEGRLTDKTVYTQLHQFVGTPAYMSPEQAEMSGLDIDTRSDIYSLGVLLYELLTGRPPFDPKELLAAGLDAMRRTIRETEPMRPSTRLAGLSGDELTTAAKRRSIEAPKLVHQVKGDLDWIVMRCLEKDRTRRYETANGLAADIQRHLENEPVVACPPSAGYRFQKMARRHRTAFVGTVVVALALVLGFGAALIGFVQAMRANAKEVELRKQSQAQELASRRRAYAAEMNTAFRSFEDHALGHVHQILDRQRPKPGEEDLRGIEWRLLWEKARGNELTNFPGEGVIAAAYSPDGAFLAYANKEIVIRDAKTRRLVTKLPAAVHSLSFSPDGRLLVGGSLTNALIWDTRTWQQVRSFPDASRPVQFSPDGRWLVTGNREGNRLWDTSTWAAVGLAPGRNYSFLLAFSPDSRFLLTTVGTDEGRLAEDRLRVWDVPSMQRRAPIVTGEPETTGRPTAITFSGDGDQVIVGKEYGEVTIWDFRARRLLRSWKAHENGVLYVAITPGSNTLVTGSGDQTVRSWDLATGRRVALLGTQQVGPSAFAVSPDGREVLGGSQNPPEVKVWSTLPHDPEPRLPKSWVTVGVISQNRIVACDDSTNGVTIWDPAKGVTAELPIYGVFHITNASITGFKMLAAVKKDGSVLAIGHADGTIELWNLDSRIRQSGWKAHPNTLYALAFSGDGKTLATGSSQGEIKLWDAETQSQLTRLEFPGTGIQCFAFSPDGSLLACGAESGLIVWDLTTRKEIIRSPCGGTPVSQVNFSPDGKLLAVTATYLDEVHVWDTTTRAQVAALNAGVQEAAWSASFSPDGRTLASAGSGIKLWNIPTFLEVGTIGEEQTRPIYVAFSPDGVGLSVGHLQKDKFMSFLRARSLAEIDRIDSGK